MKIALLYLGSRGAGSMYSYEMSRALSMRGVDILPILSVDVDNLYLWKSYYGSKLILVKTYQQSFLSLILSFFKIGTFRFINSSIRDFSPDVVYCPFGLIWSPILFRLFKGKYRIVSTVHDVLVHPEQKLINKIIIGVYSLLQKDYGRLSDDLIILNQKYIDLARKIYKKDNICVIPHASFNGYSNEYSKLIGLTYTIGFVGRIEYYKGIDILLEAFAKLKNSNIQLLIAGKGELPTNVIKDIQNNSNILFINRWIDDTEFKSLFDKVDLLVLPYKTATQSGVIPLALSFGRPVIVTNVGALSEQVPINCGIVVNLSSDEIAQAIDSLYFSADSLIEMGHQAKLYADTNLTWNTSARLLLDFLE